MSKANQFVRIIIAAAALAVFAVLATPANGAELKFLAASGQEPVIARYVVTLADSVAEDLVESSVRGMAMTYSGRLEPRPSANVRQFAITMEPARARTLSADPRVREVVEVPQSDEAGPATSSTAPSHADLSRHGLVPVAQDSSSSGTYLYDGSGNIKFIGSDSYVYDNLGRLTVAIVQESQQKYTYDAFGNRILTTRATSAAGCVGGCEAPSTVSPRNNHLDVATYDEAGNVKTVSGSTAATYSYDGTGMATRATVGSDDRIFVYTADDERIAVRNGVSWMWTVRDLNGKVLRELTSLETQSSPLALGSHTWTKDHVWRDGQLMASVFQAPSGITTYHYHLDHLGTPRLVTDSNGFLAGKHVYYPFGAEMNLTPHESTVELMKFTGHERDIVAVDNATVDYMHARYYNGNTGRFLSVDPVLRTGDAQQQPQRWNRYTYALNNPLKSVDPTGKDVVVAANYDGARTGSIGHLSYLIQDSKGNWYEYQQAMKYDSEWLKAVFGFAAGEVSLTPIPNGGTSSEVSDMYTQRYGDETAVLHTTSKDDAKIFEAAQKSADAFNAGKEHYSMFTDNCGQSGVNFLHEAGLTGAPSGPIPAELYEALKLWFFLVNDGQLTAKEPIPAIDK
jgi:RHS repeat-associated protein